MDAKDLIADAVIKPSDRQNVWIIEMWFWYFMINQNKQEFNLFLPVLFWFLAYSPGNSCSWFSLGQTRGLMVIAVGFWIHWLERTQVQTLVLELNWSELEVVVAGEGGHCVGRGPSSCLVCATSYPSQTPPGRLDRSKPAESTKEYRSQLERSSLSNLNCIYTL